MHITSPFLHKYNILDKRVHYLSQPLNKELLCSVIFQRRQCISPESSRTSLNCFRKVSNNEARGKGRLHRALRCTKEASQDKTSRDGSDAVRTWDLIQLMVVIWCITLPLGYGGVETLARLTAQDVNELSNLQKAGFAGVSELLQLGSVLYWLRSRDLGRNLLHKMERSIRQADQCVVLEGLATGCVAAAFVSLLSLLPVGSISNDNTAKQIILGSDHLASIVLLGSTILLAPLLEEIIYRGILLEGLSSNFSISLSVALSSATFAVSHFSLQNLLSLAALGNCLGSSYCVGRHSIVRSILAHSVYNLLAVKLASW